MFAVNTYEEIVKNEQVLNEKHIVVLLFVRPSLPWAKVRTLVQDAGYKVEIADVLCNLNRYMQRKQCWGACHASCAALYVAFSELCYQPQLCIGEMLGQDLYFDHSWIELDGETIHMAISMTLLVEILCQNLYCLAKIFVMEANRQSNMGFREEESRVSRLL